MSEPNNKKRLRSQFRFRKQDPKVYAPSANLCTTYYLPYNTARVAVAFVVHYLARFDLKPIRINAVSGLYGERRESQSSFRGQSETS